MTTKLLYIHGLGQSGKSATSKFFEDVLTDVDVIAPDLSPDPIEAIGQLKLICQNENPDFIYAAQSAGMLPHFLPQAKKIIVNPFTEIASSLQERIGTRPYKYPRKDGKTTYELTPLIISHFAELEKSQFDNLTDYDRDNTVAIFLEAAADEANYNEYSKHFSSVAWIEEKDGIDAHLLLLRMIVDLITDKTTWNK